MSDDEQQFYHVTNTVAFGMKQPVEIRDYGCINEMLAHCNANVRFGPPAPFEPLGELASTVVRTFGGETLGIYMRKEDRDKAKHHSTRDFSLGEALFNLEEMLRNPKKAP